MVKILQKEDTSLRVVSRPVPLQEITSAKIKKNIIDMKTAMHKEADAVAIAAPQIEIPIRMFIVSGKIFLTHKEDAPQNEKPEIPPDLVFINPELLKCSQKKKWVEEGCLSVRWLYGEVERSEKATIRAYDETGKLFTRGASGILAQVFQHEVEHLDGKLFIDKARNIKDIPPQQNKEKIKP
ncbi:MAG: peptide deformylase [bacterium]|nr:peptide deformylase [bacterium]